MKKTVVLLIVLLAGSGIVFSQTEIFESPFLPVSPEVMGQGGSFVAAAHGYNSLFYNPAGFARPDGSFTLASATAWMYSRPDRILAALEGMSDSPAKRWRILTVSMMCYAAANVAE